MRLVKVQVRKEGSKLRVTGIYRTAAGRRVRRVIAKEATPAELPMLLEGQEPLPFTS